MAQNITLLGASYSAVPAVVLPKTGGGTARFDDVSVTTAVASDVASGKVFLAANGTVTTGTASGGGGMKVKTTTATPDTASHIQFPVDGIPQVVALISPVDIPVGQTDIVATFVADPDNSLHAQYICNTANSNVAYSSGVITPSYQNGYVHLSASGVEFANTSYRVIYTYDGSVSNYGFQSVQVGSGATSITFTDLPDEPNFFICHFKSDFGTSSGYQRTIAVVYDGHSTYGLAMDSGAKALSSWSYTYNNGTLTISSQGTNDGGYFHQPGYYQLTYGYGGTVEPVEIDVQPLSVTQNGTYNAPDGVAYSPVTVNVTSGGGWQVDTKTITASTSNYPVSLEFTSMKGQPKAFFLKSTSQISSSGSTTYFYIIDMRYNGTNTTGNCFRIGSTRRVDNITSGYSWSYSGTTLTITSSAASRSASPGAFNNGYELTYFY